MTTIAVFANTYADIIAGVSIAAVLTITWLLDRRQEVPV